jgi:hypothetical protein
MSKGVLLFSVEGTRLSFRASLLEENPDVVALILSQLPFSTFLGHVVIAGETFWMPTRILALGGSNMVERQLGSVYYYAPGATINVCYGSVTEKAKVNKFAQVYDDDLETLRSIGELVYQQTVARPTTTTVRITVSLVDAFPVLTITKEPEVILPCDSPHWRVVRAKIEKAIDKIWLDEPDDLRKIRFGIIENGAGDGGRALAVLVHIKAYLMMDGADILYRMLKLKDRHLTPAQLKLVTTEVLVNSFNHFDFMGDLGLHVLHNLGADYVAALDTVVTTEDYLMLTGSLLIYINRMHRWAHIIFPWHLGTALQRPNIAVDTDLPKLIAYSEEE